MSEKINSGTYYKLTDEDKKQITKYFNEQNLEELFEFCQALAQVASYATWRNAGLYLKDVGEEKFFNSCRNCGHTFNCDGAFAIDECGDRYEKWVPMTKEQEDRLNILRNNIGA
jgi:transcription elongation factor Elf1